MSGKHLLHLETQRLAAFHWRRGQLQAGGVFAADADGLARFAEFLGQHRQHCFHLLADLADEACVVETIPRLRGADRQALLERKLAQHFPGSELTMAVSLGRDSTNRHSEKLLLTAFTRPEQFAPWLTCLDQAEVALAGIYSVTQLSGRLLEILGQPVHRGLLLSRSGDSIRESYLRDGQVIFSRRAALNDHTGLDLAGACADQASQLRHYLIGQRLLDRGESLPVCIIAPPQAVTASEKACRNSPELGFTIFDNPAVARRLKLKNLPTGDGDTPLFLHLLAESAPRQQFAGAARRRLFRLRQVGRCLLGLSFAILLGSALWTANNAYRTDRLDGESQELARDSAESQRRYQEITATFPPLAVDYPDLRRLTDRYAELMQRQGRLAPAWRSISQALEPVPAIELSSLDWKIDATGPGTAITESITLAGNFPEESLSPRHREDYFEQFAAPLRDAPGTRLDILQHPDHLDPQRVLTGGDREPANDQTSGFALRLTRQIAP